MNQLQFKKNTKKEAITIYIERAINIWGEIRRERNNIVFAILQKLTI